MNETIFPPSNRSAVVQACALLNHETMMPWRKPHQNKTHENEKLIVDGDGDDDGDGDGDGDEGSSYNDFSFLPKGDRVKLHRCWLS